MNKSVSSGPPVARILVVEDDPAIGPRTVAGLLGEGFDAVLAADGPAGRSRMARESFDLVVLDLMLPGRSGHQLLGDWHDASVPVIVLTARTRLDDRLRSFDLGAADFLAKPFFMEELVARIRVRLGMSAVAEVPRTVQIGDCQLDLDARRVTRGDQDLGLTSHEVNLLALLATHPGRAFTRTQLAQGALPEPGARLERTLDSHICRIRRKLGPTAARRVRTIRHVGYRFDA